MINWEKLLRIQYIGGWGKVRVGMSKKRSEDFWERKMGDLKVFWEDMRR